MRYLFLAIVVWNVGCSDVEIDYAAELERIAVIHAANTENCLVQLRSIAKVLAERNGGTNGCITAVMCEPWRDTSDQESDPESADQPYTERYTADGENYLP